MNRFQGPLRRHPTNPRYFTDDSGNAIYLTGSHTWAVLQDMWLEAGEPRLGRAADSGGGRAPGPRRNMDYEGFLQMLEENGHNFLRFWSWMHTKNAGWSETPTLFDPQPFARHPSSPADSGQPLAGSRVPGSSPANDGQPRFDLSVWNDAYFSRLRERVEQAMRRGIYTGVMLFEAPTGSHPATGACSSIATIPRRRTAAK